MTDELYPARIGLALTAADARRIHAEGRLIALIGIENGYVIGRDLSLIERYHQLGARYMTLAHNGHNDLADSANVTDMLIRRGYSNADIAKLWGGNLLRVLAAAEP